MIAPALAVLIGVGFAEAIGTSLAVIALTSAAAFAAHLTSGGIDWPVTASFSPMWPFESAKTDSLWASRSRWSSCSGTA